MFDSASPRPDERPYTLQRQGPGSERKKGLKGLFSSRPFGFWQWPALGQYLEFLAGLIVVLGISQAILGRWMWYIDA